jgi:hypothetical protein
MKKIKLNPSSESEVESLNEEVNSEDLSYSEEHFKINTLVN